MSGEGSWHGQEELGEVLSGWSEGGEEAGEVERGLSSQDFGLIFWNLCFILSEQTEAFKES